MKSVVLVAAYKVDSIGTELQFTTSTLSLSLPPHLLLFVSLSLSLSMTRPPRFLGGVSSSSSSSSSTTAAAQPPEAVAVESDFVVILAALLCALICVVGFIAVARCAWLRRSTSSSSAAAPNKGLKKKILQSLPRLTYDSSAANSKLGECPICLAEYADGDEIRLLPQCGHGFHVACIDTWLGSHSSCPSCRQILAVARCRKCGDCPEVEVKAREDGGSSSGFLPV